ncbi:transmembrane protein 135-like [Anthonomus grandis grandis]|uniref:transmembrane protein 135-like n=1 Tax=Anthonomus grandis grandis TaxID=2921223 RepID=UPI002165FF2B|nr:transmembrane protein 135-like [Anthonomus grandis grandis]
MPQVLSKIPLSAPITTSCYQYVHPWNQSCSVAIAGCFLYCVFDSLRIYGTVYLCTLLMKGRIPTKEDIRRTLNGILQSTAFLSFTGFGYSLFLCSLRRLLGHFNLLTVSFWPAFLSSAFAILIERPSRRTLLCLYVSNIATETVWNMALSRGMVRNIPYGDVAIFGGSMAVLLAYYKSGHHAAVPDSMFKILKFVIGPYEEKDFGARVTHEANAFYRQQVATADRRSQSENIRPHEGLPKSSHSKKPKNLVYHLITQMLRIYKRLIHRMKCLGRHQACPHPFSCLYYVMGGTGKMFSVGLGIQITLKLVLNLKRIFTNPKTIKQILLKKETLNLGLFLGLYSGMFRGVLCTLRRIFGKDDPVFAFPASLLASVAFKKYPDTTVALYVAWKSAQITYNIGIQKGYVPKIPGFTEFLYCLSTGILFHAAILEPTNLRASYWKFLHSISGGRIACMAREPLDIWGLNTSASLETVLKATKTIPVVYF